MYLIGLLYRSFRVALTGLLDWTTEPLPEGAAAGGSGILAGLLYRLYGKAERREENFLDRMNLPEAHPAEGLSSGEPQYTSLGLYTGPKDIL